MFIAAFEAGKVKSIV